MYIYMCMYEEYEFEEHVQHWKTTTAILEICWERLTTRFCHPQIKKVDQVDRKKLLHLQKHNNKQRISLSVHIIVARYQI